MEVITIGITIPQLSIIISSMLTAKEEGVLIDICLLNELQNIYKKVVFKDKKEGE